MLQNTIKQIRTWDVCILFSPSYVYLGEMRMGEFLYFPPKSPDLKMGKKLASAVFLALRASCKRESTKGA
jgi:hypothetical protein